MHSADHPAWTCSCSGTPRTVLGRWAVELHTGRIRISKLGQLDGVRYAGTWSHDEQGGHLYGVFERDGVGGR
jgi:hypothetical protein